MSKTACNVMTRRYITVITRSLYNPPAPTPYDVYKSVAKSN